jgi:two-component system response regulator MprA
MRILIVDDEPAVRTSLERALSLEGYDVDLAADGAAALDRLAAAPPDAVLMLPARAGVDERVAGPAAGADDYLVKPFALRELRARLRALLRRIDRDAGAARFADLALDADAHEVHRGQRRIELSRTEFALLELFMRHPRQVLTRAQIFESVWGYDLGATSNALGVYIGYLRRKTEEAGEPRLLHTVRGVGYVLREG